MTLNLILLRHARANESIDETGVAESISSGLQLGGHGFKIDSVYHSSYLRARQTAKLLAVACNGLESVFKSAADQDTPREELQFLKADWLDSDKIATGHVSLNEVQQHIKAFDDHHKTVCLVGHGDDIPIIIDLFLNGYASYGSKNASPVVLEFDAEKWGHVTRSRLSGIEAFKPQTESISYDTVDKYEPIIRDLG